ncbi:MAG: flagellar hook-length control protein FliK [Sphingorhabdus sp.]
MTPIFALPLAPNSSSTPFRSAAQAEGFEALLSVSTGPIADGPAMPETIGEPMRPRSAVKENVVAIGVAPESKIETSILPLLAAFAGVAAPEATTVVSQSSVRAEVSSPEIESDDAEPTHRACEEIGVPALVVAPTPIAAPDTVATTTTALPVVLVSAAATTKATEPTKVAIEKGGPPVMERDVEIGVHVGDVPVQANAARQNTRSALQQPMQEIPLLANNTVVIQATDIAAMLASNAVESNAVTGAGFQTIMTDRTADTAVRPLTDASVIVAERVLDVARGSLWLDQLAGDIAAVQDHDRDLSFRLIPAQLGHLDVKIASSDEGVQLNFSTQTDEAAQIIGNAQARLVEELKTQGVRVASSEVNTGSGQSSFGQQNGSPARAQTISEFDRLHPASSETTPTPEPQAGRFA